MPCSGTIVARHRDSSREFRPQKQERRRAFALRRPLGHSIFVYCPDFAEAAVAAGCEFIFGVLKYPLIVFLPILLITSS